MINAVWLIVAFFAGGAFMGWMEYWHGRIDGVKETLKAWEAAIKRAAEERDAEER